MEIMRYIAMYYSWRFLTSPLMRFSNCFSYFIASLLLRYFCRFRYSRTRIAAI